MVSLITFDTQIVAAVVAPFGSGPSNSVYPQRAHAVALHVVVELHAYHAVIVEFGCSDPEMTAMVQVPSVNYILAPRQLLPGWPITIALTPPFGIRAIIRLSCVTHPREWSTKGMVI